MMTNLYDLERLRELDQLERQAQMKHDWGRFAPQGRASTRFARLTFVTYLLTAFRVA